MAPHSVALRALGVATVVYAGVLLAEPVAALRAVYALGPVYESILKQDAQATEQLAAAGVSAAEMVSTARWQMLKGGWEHVAPAVVLSAVGLLGGVLLALRRRAGPWIVLVFALWPAVAWAIQRVRRSPLQPQLAVPLARKTIRFHLAGKTLAVDAATYATCVQIAFVAVTLAILAWAFVVARRAGRDGSTTPDDGPTAAAG
jgi:hypothetical protein